MSWPDSERAGRRSRLGGHSFEGLHSGQRRPIAAIIIALAACSSSITLAAQLDGPSDAAFRAAVHSVVITARVADGAGSSNVPRLGPDDFSIEIDHRPQRVVSVDFAGVAGHKEVSACPNRTCLYIRMKYSASYTVGVELQEPAGDGKPHDIHVAVNRPGLSVVTSPRAVRLRTEPASEPEVH